MKSNFENDIHNVIEVLNPLTDALLIGLLIHKVQINNELEYLKLSKKNIKDAIWGIKNTIRNYIYQTDEKYIKLYNLREHDCDTCRLIDKPACLSCPNKYDCDTCRLPDKLKENPVCISCRNRYDKIFRWREDYEEKRINEVLEYVVDDDFLKTKAIINLLTPKLRRV